MTRQHKDDELAALIRRAQTDDPKALETLRTGLEARPEVWGELYDRVEVTKEQVAEVISCNDPIMKQGIFNWLEKSVHAVAGPYPSVLERMLAERVCMCQLQLAFAEGFCAFALRRDTKNHREQNALMRRCETWQRMLLSAIKTLEMIRRTPLPPIQLNIADKQVNISGKANGLPKSAFPQGGDE